MIKKYKTESTMWKVDAKITTVEVERESNASVWIGGLRRAKITNWDILHDTWDKAHTHLLGHAESQLEAAEKQLEAATNQLFAVEAMVRP
jgi:hypothetical protein